MAPTRRTLTRQRVVEAATETIRAGAFEGMTIRSLAAALGVTPMALYRHVKDRDDLLDAVVGDLLGPVWRPDADPDDARRWVEEAAERLRAFLVDQPAALEVYSHHPVVSPAAIDRMDAMMEVLRAALDGESAARRAYAAIHTYTVGFATLEASRQGWDPEGVSPGSVAGQLAAYTSPRQFREGLGYLLDGIGVTPTGP